MMFGQPFPFLPPSSSFYETLGLLPSPKQRKEGVKGRVVPTASLHKREVEGKKKQRGGWERTKMNQIAKRRTFSLVRKLALP